MIKCLFEQAILKMEDTANILRFLILRYSNRFTLNRKPYFFKMFDILQEFVDLRITFQLPGKLNFL